MKIFQTLKALTEYRRRHMPYVRTLEDMDILREIGFHQETGDPITLKVLFLKGIGSVATIQRRLRRLKQFGAVHESRAVHDGRLVKLTLDEEIFHAYSALYAPLRARKEPKRGPVRSAGHGKRRRRA